MKIVKRIGLLVIFSVAGAIIMYFYSSASVHGAFIQWESLGTPPGKAVKVIALDYVKTESGDTYQHCGNDCWVKSDNPIPDSEYLSLKNCGNLPPLTNYIDFKAVCEPYGLGVSLKIVAIDKNGFVYSWHQNLGGEGDGLILLLSPFIGAVAGFFVGCIMLLTILFSDFLEWLQKRAEK
jgi:hypothetical protein